MRVTFNGISINCVLEGQPGRPVSPSATRSPPVWRCGGRRSAALTRHFQVLRYDMRGHGASEAPDGPYSIEMLADDVQGLWDALGIERSYFAGLSVGGKIGLMLGLRYPERLSGLVLCNTTSRIPPEGRPIWDERIAQVEDGGMESQLEATLRRWFTDGFRSTDPETVAWITSLIRATPPQGFIGCCRAIQSFDVMQRLGRIDTPAAAAAGRERPRHAAGLIRKRSGTGYPVRG